MMASMKNAAATSSVEKLLVADERHYAAGTVSPWF
jgi:hypothetical protein